MQSRSILSHFVFVMSFMTVAATGVLLWAGYRLYRQEFPEVEILRSSYPVVVYQGKSKPPKIIIKKTRPPGWVKLGEVSKEATGAIVVSEDWAFFSHPGYDANQIKEAIKEDWESGHYARGASTITQQVARNVFLSQDKNLWRKLKELFLAMQLEKKVGKKKILETYLNIAEWGEGVFGISGAARLYFKKSPATLTAKEGAFLAMLLPSPKKYSQSFRKRKLTSYAKETTDDILDKMRQAGYLTPEQRLLEAATLLSFEAVASAPDPSPVMSEAPEVLDLKDDPAGEPAT